MNSEGKGEEGRGRDELPTFKSKLPHRVQAGPDRRTLFGAPESVWRSGSARSRWGSLECSPRPSSRNEGVLLLRGEEEGKG